MSDTPRVDSALWRCDSLMAGYEQIPPDQIGDDPDDEYVKASDARQLERELDKTRANLAAAIFYIPGDILCGDVRAKAEEFHAEMTTLRKSLSLLLEMHDAEVSPGCKAIIREALNPKPIAD